ncbi:MAG TPA: radical SAM protein [Candidatus Wunengus sp. YC60]|uniref:radical SAM protein n=1 Tax=Candidatus Wunengus sp. YC60 TaxID=3367697 RepID=UPI004027C5AB
MEGFTNKRISSTLPRIPQEGCIDLTYRCNNTCRHCWLWKSPNAPEGQNELSFAEIRRIVDEARALGTSKWGISGGEPMLRPDFPQIFDYITSKAVSYSINTNGTMITPDIACLLKRKGNKMIALYGATAEVYDSVTRNPGGFEKAMRGFEYMRLAGAGFTVQLIPMNENWAQWNRMVELAKSLSANWRVGAPWLYLSSDMAPVLNEEIARQRLSPRHVIELDSPDLAYEERMEECNAGAAGCSPRPVLSACGAAAAGDDRLFAQCIAVRRNFHIDPYGTMSFCSFIKDPNLRYDLRRGTFREAWEEFIPSLAGTVRGGREYLDNCGSCEKRADCLWCAVYGYLETGRYSAPVPYLCEVAGEARRYKDERQDKHRRYFNIAGITVRVESDLDFSKAGFKKEISSFAVDGPGDDNISLRHYFELPEMKGKDLGKELYRKSPWAVSRKNGTWYYRGISPDGTDKELHRVAVFNAAHTRGTIYSLPQDESMVKKDGWHSLSLFPTDQIWLAPLLADRKAVLLHSAAAVLNGQGLLFVGHSEAGKSTTVTLLKNAAVEANGHSSIKIEILCDDRNIVRRWDEGFRVHGTWSHGDVSDVSGASAPLRAILFLEQSLQNDILPLTDRKDIWKRLLATLIKPMVTAEWWQKVMDVLEQIVNEAPCYTMRFDRSGVIVPELEKLAQAG